LAESEWLLLHNLHRLQFVQLQQLLQFAFVNFVNFVAILWTDNDDSDDNSPWQSCHHRWQTTTLGDFAIFAFISIFSITDFTRN